MPSRAGPRRGRATAGRSWRWRASWREPNGSVGRFRTRSLRERSLWIGPDVSAQPPPRLFGLPSDRRRSSFSHARTLAWGELARFLEAEGLADLESFRVVDRYEGPGVASDQTKSSVRLTFRSAERTLSQEEVNRERDRLAAALQDRFGVSF